MMQIMRQTGDTRACRSGLVALVLGLMLAGCGATEDARLVRKTDPTYPQAARTAGVEGSVTVRYTIDARGKPVNVEIVSAEPPGYFEASAIAAVERWTYQPALRRGKPVPVTGVRSILTFTITDTN